jgi:hypothetical protein
MHDNGFKNFTNILKISPIAYKRKGNKKMNSKKNLHIRLYADSLALARQGSITFSQRYISIIRRWWINQNIYNDIELVDRSIGGQSILSIYEMYNSDVCYFGSSGDILIIHTGIVDCAPRPVPIRVRNFISVLPKFFKDPAVRFLHNYRSRIQKSGLMWKHVNPEEFSAYYATLLKKAGDNFPRIYCISIAPTNPATEVHSPGYMASVKQYNEIIKDCINQINKKNVYYIDIFSTIMNDYSNIDTYILAEDGHHLTPLTHRLIAEDIIQKEISNHSQ